jgi:peptidoglycan/LPS O-acetylase OafA/YrhL
MSGLSVTTRLHTLDYLRGLAAFSIMIYHYSTWTVGNFSSEDVLGRIGLYGVSVFYVLSGLTLYHVYYQNMNGNLNDIRDFFIKRFFRIFPLLWLTIFITCLLKFEFPGSYKLFLNVTGLFSILRYDAYIGTGVWSIGNELCFYLFFPFFVILSKGRRFLFALLSIVIFAVYLYFAYFIIPEFDVLKNSGSHLYINPLNQVFLFLGGFLIGLFFEKLNVDQPFVAVILSLSVLAFVFYPVSGDRINLVQQTPRLVFTTICFVFCFSFYKATIQLPAWLDNVFTRLAEYSYSLYLLHPLVWRFFENLSKMLKYSLHPAAMFVLCAALSLLLSRFVYFYYEKFFMRRGRSWSEKFVLKTSVKS